MSVDNLSNLVRGILEKEEKYYPISSQRKKPAYSRLFAGIKKIKQRFPYDQRRGIQPFYNM